MSHRSRYNYPTLSTTLIYPYYWHIDRIKFLQFKNGSKQHFKVLFNYLGGKLRWGDRCKEMLIICNGYFINQHSATLNMNPVLMYANLAIWLVYRDLRTCINTAFALLICTCAISDLCKNGTICYIFYLRYLHVGFKCKVISYNLLS